jgi:hypothetical protein
MSASVTFESFNWNDRPRGRHKYHTSAAAARVPVTVPPPAVFAGSGFSAQTAARQSSIEILKEIQFEGRTFEFIAPVTCVAVFEGRAWTHCIQSLGLSGYGRSEQESRGSLAMDLAASWDEIAIEEDAALTVDAQAWKARLNSAIRTVR